MPASDRADRIAAALCEWDKWRYSLGTNGCVGDVLDAGDTLAALLRESQPEPGHVNPSDWWCPSCQRHVSGDDVTYHERHDPRSGGCGNFVLPERPQPEPAPVVEMPDKFAAFGRMVWDVITQRMSTAMMDETDADNAELAVKAGLADHVRYDPEKHGHVEDAEPGDKIVWWGAR